MHPAFPYVAPFAAFLVFLIAGDFGRMGEWEYPFRVAVLASILWVCSRKVLDLRPSRWTWSLTIGAAVFAVWIMPDVLWPAYRQHWLFQNPVTGTLSSSIPEGLQMSPLVLVFRSLRAAVIVPLVEELFWRGWLMRWLIRPDFQSVPFGTYGHASFIISALLFASEHGPYWEVGLLAGVAYNAWAVRTKRLSDCILAHAVTNAILSAYVIGWGQWQYWL